MGAPGANIHYNGPRYVVALAMKLKYVFSRYGYFNFGRSKPAGTDGTDVNRVGHVGWKVGVPASNTAADAPTGLNDVIYNTSTGIAYQCSAFTDTSTFTYIKLAA